MGKPTQLPRDTRHCIVQLIHYSHLHIHNAVPQRSFRGGKVVGYHAPKAGLDDYSNRRFRICAHIC